MFNSFRVGDREYKYISPRKKGDNPHLSPSGTADGVHDFNQMEYKAFAYENTLDEIANKTGDHIDKFRNQYNKFREANDSRGLFKRMRDKLKEVLGKNPNFRNCHGH